MAELNYWTQRVNRRAALRGAGLAAAGLAGAALVGCGGEDDAAPAPTAAAGQATTAPAATAAAAADAPKRGGTAVFASIEPRSLDPHFDVFRTIGPVYDNLFRFSQDLTTFHPDLAEALPEQPDDLTYVFKLRQGVKWHNVEPANGRDFVAADVKYSIDRQSTDEAGVFQHAYYFKDKLESIDTPDDHTVVIKTREPYAPFMSYVGNPWTVMVNRETVEKYADLTEHAVGTGPFIFKEWQKEVRISLTRNPDYWMPELPYLDGIEYLISIDPDTNATLFIDKKIMAYGAGQAQLKRVQDARGADSRYAKQPLQFWRQFRMSPTEESFRYEDYAGTVDDVAKNFADIRVREAVVRGIDKQAVLDLVHNGDGMVTLGPILPQFTNWALKEELAGYDPKKSKELLAAAGITELRGPMMWASTSPQADQIGEVIKEQLAEIGVITDLEPMELAAYYNKTYKYRYTFSHHVPLNNPEPDENLSSYFGPNSTYFKHYNPEIFELVNKQAKTVDFAERQAIVKEAQEKIVLDFPIKHMFTTNVHYFIDQRLKNWNFSLDGYEHRLYDPSDNTQQMWLDA
ncbi:MAG: ABC transporter substrate-binding protein [Dehalococcoidia bacterium]